MRRLVILLTLIVAAIPAAAQEILRIEGQATYFGSARLPERAVLEVDLLDLSRKDEKATLLSRMQFSTDGVVPIPFILSYDAGLLRVGGLYSIAARLKLRNDVIYRSTAIQPVLGSSVDTRPQVVMEPVVPVASGGTPVGLKWRVDKISGVERLSFTKTRVVFDEEGEVTGNAGCNSFRSSYKIDGQKLEFGGLRLTKRGCPSTVMERERAFRLAMRATVSFQRDGDTLKFFDISDLETLRMVRE